MIYADKHADGISQLQCHQSKCSVPQGDRIAWTAGQSLAEEKNLEHQRQTVKSMPKTNWMDRKGLPVDDEHWAFQTDRLGNKPYLD